MLNKNFKTFFNLLRKEKVAIISGITVGVVFMAVNPYDNWGLDLRSVITAEADSTTSGNATSASVVADQLTQAQAYEDLVRSAEEDYKAYLKAKEREEAERKRVEQERKAREEAERKAKEEARIKAEEEARKKAEEEKRKASKERTAVFRITGYCSCKKCCGKYSPEVTGKKSKTATGTTPKQGRTIAVDPDVIPYGSKVYINGNEYIAEDTGGAINGKSIDVYFNSHKKALKWGVKYLEVTYIIK